MIPVPGYAQTTPYGRRGPYWSCSADAQGNGIHTGADYAAPSGTKVVAARGGTAAHVNYGSAFGSHQLAVRCADGTEDFYAHMRSRVPHGQLVDPGAKVGEVGAEGNVTGSHLHFERHKSPGWSCSICVDPAPSINYQPSSGGGGSAAGGGEAEEMPTYSHARRNASLTLQPDVWHTISWDDAPANSVFTEGQAQAAIGGSTYVATLTCELSDTEGGNVHTRLQQVWGGEVLHTSPSSGAGATNQVVDTRAGKVAKDRNLRWQIRAKRGGKLTRADCLLLHW